MINRLNWVILSPLIVIAALGIFFYGKRFTDKKPPIVTIEGIRDGGTYTGEVTSIIKGNDNYSVGDITIWLDDKCLTRDHKINRRDFELPFTISMHELPQGEHLLKVVVRDRSSKKNQTIKSVPFSVDNIPLQAAFVKSADHNVYQGRTLHVQFQANKVVKDAVVETLSQKFACVPESKNSSIYECFIPISCDETPSEHIFKIVITDAVGNKTMLENKFRVVLYPFKTQNLTVAKEKVAEEATLGKTEGDLEIALAELVKHSPAQKLWSGAFYMPCDVKGVSTEFGVERTTQDRGKYRHAAVDLLGTPRAVVWAAQDGRLVLKDRFAHSGNTIVLDHGCGIFTMYYHLEDFAKIEVGDMIKKGKPVGTIGKTGYASGYHLHWEMRINNIAVDPVEWTKKEF